MDNKSTNVNETTETKTGVNTMLVVWFSKIEWRQYFIGLLWRMIIIPAYLPLMVAFPLAIIVNVLIWFITGEGYLYEIENATEWYVTKIWRKAFP